MSNPGDLDERAYTDVPWRRVPTQPWVRMNVSLSQETRSVLPALAPSGVWLAACEAVAYRERVSPTQDPRRIEWLAALHCERTILQQLLIHDVEQPGAYRPDVSWYREEEARRKRAAPVIVTARLRRDVWHRVTRRRGAMKPSEYAVHVVFGALAAAGFDPLTFVGSIDYAPEGENDER